MRSAIIITAVMTVDSLTFLDQFSVIDRVHKLQSDDCDFYNYFECLHRNLMWNNS
jgi:hypothetical protein